jgi:hypothetical protein
MNNDALLNVRKAYRLLFEYQERILNLMQYIGQTYDIPATKGNPLFSSKGSNRVDNWAWDYIYMYHFVFNFWRTTEEDPVWLNAYLLNDSGFYEKEENKNNNAKKFDINNFELVEDSKSKLTLVSGLPGFEWSWPHDTWPFDDFIKRNEGIKEVTNEDGEQGIVVFRTYDLEDFFDEKKALNSLKEFAEFCKVHDLPIEITEKLK